MIDMSIKTKLILSLCIILILGFFVTNIVNYHVSKTALRTNLVDESLPIISNNVYSEIQKDLMRPIHISSLMAHDTFVKDWMLDGEKDVEKIRKYLMEIKERYDFNSVFLVSSKTKNYYHFKGIHKQISKEDAHDVWYYEFLQQDEDYDLDVDTDEADNNNLTVFINHRLYDYDRELLGVIGVGLSMNQIGEHLSEYKGEFNRNIFLTDKNGVIQIHSDLNLIECTNVFEQKGLIESRDTILSSKKELKFIEFDRGKKHFLLITRYIPEFDWYLFVEQDETSTLAGIRKNLVRNLIIGLLISCIVIIINVFTVNFFQRKLELMATADPLTGASNRKMFFDKAKAEFNRSRRYKEPLTVLMIDLDHFKNVNDTYGHFAGDKVLKSFVQVCNETLRESDFLGRLGGEEFGVVLVETDQTRAETVSSRLLSAISTLKTMVSDQSISITASMGLSALHPEDTKIEHVMKRADKALYNAKQNGRNRIEIK
jgi:diguanylate cyclase (GGDEF)-like protein